MIFVAATAMGLAGGLAPHGRPGHRTGWQHDPVIGSVWLALALTMATLIARLRSPRPRWARLTRQPGFLASVAVAATLVVAVISLGEGLVGAIAEGVGDIDRAQLFWSLGTSLNFNARYAVVTAWSIQVISCRWRPAPCWLDRLGLAMGGYWVAAPSLIQITRVLNAFL